MYIKTEAGWKSLGGIAERFAVEGAKRKAALENAREESKKARDAFIQATRQRQPIETLRALSRQATTASHAYLAL